MRRKTLAATAALALAAGSLAACTPGQRDVQRICVGAATREPVEEQFCRAGSDGYEWADEDDDDFDLIKKRRKSSTVVKPVVPQVKQPVVVNPPSQPKPPTVKSGTGGMGRK